MIAIAFLFRGVKRAEPNGRFAATCRRRGVAAESS
jgi:hypothetical protein